MQQTVTERFKLIIEEKASSETKFSEMIGVSQTTLNSQLNSVKGVKMESIIAVLDRFQDISAEWLLRGKGDMNLSLSNYNGEENDEILDIKTRYDKLRIEYDEEIVEHQKLLSQLEYMEEYNQRLVLEVHNLKKRLSAYEREKEDII